MTTEKIYQTAQECAEYALKRCKQFSKESLVANRKVDKTWVTQADEQLEKELREKISQKYPDHGIVGEEFGGAIDQSIEWSWVLDPIDGTFSFVHGIPFYSSLIAVLHYGVPTIGFAILPELDIIMSARKGDGAFINGVRYTKPQRLAAETIELVATADFYRFRMESQNHVLNFLMSEKVKARTYPDALGYYLLLNGSVRAFVDPKIEVWDVAPFHVILPEAGFAISNWQGDTQLQRGTSVAYAIDDERRPLHCEDILSSLKNLTAGRINSTIV